MELLKEIIMSILFVAAVSIVGISIQGCVGPALLGLKSYQGSDGSRMDFITGADFSFGANGVDSVDNNRGISPAPKAAKGRY